MAMLDMGGNLKPIKHGIVCCPDALIQTVRIGSDTAEGGLRFAGDGEWTLFYSCPIWERPLPEPPLTGSESMGTMSPITADGQLISSSSVIEETIGELPLTGRLNVLLNGRESLGHQGKPSGIGLDAGCQNLKP